MWDKRRSGEILLPCCGWCWLARRLILWWQWRSGENGGFSLRWVAHNDSHSYNGTFVCPGNDRLNFPTVPNNPSSVHVSVWWQTEHADTGQMNLLCRVPSVAMTTVYSPFVKSGGSEEGALMGGREAESEGELFYYVSFLLSQCWCAVSLKWYNDENEYYLL